MSKHTILKLGAGRTALIGVGSVQWVGAEGEPELMSRLLL